MDCRVLFTFSQLIRTQIEYFDYDVLSDIFVGDFDVSGKRNVLDSFCKLLVEIRQHSAETLRKHAEKRTGIAAELLSKSVLNILEAATSLMSQMTKPAHIVFVVGALGKFMGDCIASVMDKGCRMCHKYQANVTTMVKTALSTLKEHYSGPYSTSLLSQMEPVFITGLRWSRTRQHLVTFWQQTFDRASHLNVSRELSTALEQNKFMTTNFASEQKSLSVPDICTTSMCSDTNLDMSSNEDSVNEEVNKRTFFKRAQPSTPVLNPRTPVNEDSSEQYAVIQAQPCTKKMRLTDHQKEKLIEKSDSLLCFTEESRSVELVARLPPGYTADSNSHESSPLIKASGKAATVEERDSADKVVSEDEQPGKSSSVEKDVELACGIMGDAMNENRACVCAAPEGSVEHAVRSEEPYENQSGASHSLLPTFRTICRPTLEAVNAFTGKVSVSKISNLENKEQSKEDTARAETISLRIDEQLVPGTSDINVPLSPKTNVNEPPKTPTGILKKSGTRTTYPAVNCLPEYVKKCKHVHFDSSIRADDDLCGSPRRRIFHRSKNSLFPDSPLNNRPRTASPTKWPAVLPVNKDPAKAVFPALIGSTELIPPQIYSKLAPSMSSLALRSLMKSRGVVTVGDLACLSEKDIETFPFREQKLTRFQRVLEDHLKTKCKVSKENVNESEKSMLHSQKAPVDYAEEVAPEMKISSLSDDEIEVVSARPSRCENPFQHGVTRFRASPAKRFDTNKAVSNSLPEKQQVPEINENVPLSDAKEGSIGQAQEIDTGREVGDPKPLKKLVNEDANSNNELKSRPSQNMVAVERDNGGDVDTLVKSAFHALLKDPVVAAISGTGRTRAFSTEQLLSFSRACATFQMTVLSSAASQVHEAEDVEEKKEG